jgi:hypothetical protein
MSVIILEEKLKINIVIIKVKNVSKRAFNTTRNIV